jgi:polyketide biosynthesis acyl carrier protein
MNQAQDKARIVEVIRANIIKNIDDVDVNEEEIDLSKSMKDYGANSLDIIEVVSCSMRELNIKIPRSELTDITTIDELADKFLLYMK